MIISKYYEKDGKMYVEASDYDKILYELKNSNEEISKLESELESKVSEIESLKRQIEKLASIRTRCHESARDSFDLGMYGLLHIVTADELKNSNENVAKIESELFDVQKSADEYYNKCIDLTKQVTELESELEVKDNLPKIKNGLLGNNDELPTDPIEVAQMLINSTYEYEASNLEKALFKCGDTRITERYYIDDLEQIAEHLLVYCRHHREDEKQ